MIYFKRAQPWARFQKFPINISFISINDDKLTKKITFKKKAYCWSTAESTFSQFLFIIYKVKRDAKKFLFIIYKVKRDAKENLRKELLELSILYWRGNVLKPMFQMLIIFKCCQCSSCWCNLLDIFSANVFTCLIHTTHACLFIRSVKAVYVAVTLPTGRYAHGVVAPEFLPRAVTIWN